MNDARNDTTPGSRPRAACVMLVRLATRVLPRGTVRERYRQELVAEMFDMSPRTQRQHAVSVLARAGALRRAVVGSPGTAKERTMRKPIRCMLGWHHDKSMSTEDGSRYRRCARCHRDHPGSNDNAVPTVWY